jgi:hypothetical protein
LFEWRIRKTIFEVGRVAWLFEPRDIWIGVYWNSERHGGWRELTVWVCLLPMLPIRVLFWKRDSSPASFM